MEPVLNDYLKIHSALSADKTDGVKTAVEAIAQSAKQIDPEKAPADHAEHYKHIPHQIASACTELQSADDIKATREAFKTLSKPVAMWVRMAKPKEIAVMYCPMVDSEWVQRGQEVSNPYYGSEMATCGKKVGGAD
jgi:Cu(I)/Ag(I) efflux system membrane fusion protein